MNNVIELIRTQHQLTEELSCPAAVSQEAVLIGGRISVDSEAVDVRMTTSQQQGSQSQASQSASISGPSSSASVTSGQNARHLVPHLTEHSVLLEGQSDAPSLGRRVRLVLSELRNYAFFPGQVRIRVALTNFLLTPANRFYSLRPVECGFSVSRS